MATLPRRAGRLLSLTSFQFELSTGGCTSTEDEWIYSDVMGILSLVTTLATYPSRNSAVI